MQTSHGNLQEVLKEGGRTGSADVSGRSVRQSLVVAEVALALTLLVGAGLLIQSVGRLQGVDPGFDSRSVLTFDLALPVAKYRSDTAQILFYDQALDATTPVSGVQSAGITSVMPFAGNWSTSSFNIEGVTPGPNRPSPWGDYRIVSPSFFQTLRIPLRQGRYLDSHDRLGSLLVAVVDEEFVRKYFPAQPVLGKRITYGGKAPDGSTLWITIVGVVGHTMHEALDAKPRLQVYVPYGQRGTPMMSVAVRVAGDPRRVVPAVRTAIHSVDANMPLANVNTLADLIEASVGQRRLTMLLLGTFSGIALVLAAIGIYGVMSYQVSQRGRELGIRMALGAARRGVLALVLRQGMRLALAGVAIGALGAATLTRLLTNQLYAIRPTDPMTFAVVAVTLGAVALLATLLPALRATRIDPVVALREE